MKSAWIFFRSLLIIVSVWKTTGLTCYRCQGDPDYCARFSKVQRCQSFPNDPASDQICASYYVWNDGLARVEKGCKARRSCRDDEAQPDNACGLHDGKDKTCRCCCERDQCNRLKRGCIYDSVCSKPRKPPNGFVVCDSSRLRGSKCNFTCLPGYDLLGAKSSTCVLDRRTRRLRWSAIGQRCILPIRCIPMLKPPINGKMKCRNKKPNQQKVYHNYADTVCTFKCNNGYRRIGSTVSRCQFNRNWSNETPNCEPRLCTPLPDYHKLTRTCTNGNMIKSVCTFGCNAGYKMIGHNITECRPDRKDRNNQEWTNHPPTCAIIKCEPPQHDPYGGKVRCTNSNYENSVCTFSCDQDYDIDGTTQESLITICRDNGDSLGRWTRPAARCSPIKCEPKFTNLINGRVVCTNGNIFDSECTFTCNKGYDLDDTNLLTVMSACQDDADGDNVGIWSIIPPPTCSAILCQPPLDDPANGKVVCTQENRLGSVCTFRCDEFYDMDGTTNVTQSSFCKNNGNGDSLGSWSQPPPTCTVIICQRLPPLRNGHFECTSYNLVGSICSFRCDLGHELFGAKRITCEDHTRDGDRFGEWTLPQPTCKRIYCPAQKYDNKRLNRDCRRESSGRFPAGTVCSYACSLNGHYLVGNSMFDKAVRPQKLDVACLASKQWSSKSPRCLPVTCDSLGTPSNGHPPQCTDGNRFRSMCIFACEAGYKLSHRFSLVCESDGNDHNKKGKWSRDVPKCLKRECDEIGQRKFGTVSYTNNLKIGSIAQLNCDDGYTSKLYNRYECLPADEKNQFPYWSKTENICCVRCKINRILKFALLIDKTVVMNFAQWERILTWCTDTLNHLFTSGFTINFGLVLFDIDLDSENSIPLKRLQHHDEIYEIKDILQEIYYLGEGPSNTGKALNHVSEEIFQVRKWEEPYVILISDWSISDDVTETAEKMRSEGINIIALGFKHGVKTEREMSKITGDKKNVILVDGMGDMRRVSTRMNEISKRLGCQRSRRTQSCPD